MEHTQLGRSGLTVSLAALGTMNFGTGETGATPADEAVRIVETFLDRGGNLIDTADIYNAGDSERVVGRAIARRRDEVVLATKGGGPAPGVNHGLSRLSLTRAVEGSLRRLGVEHLDLYQCHVPDPRTPIEETVGALADLVRAGKIRYAGCSNFTAAGITAAQWAAERLSSPGFVGLQAHYSLLARAIEAEIVPTCERLGLGVLAYAPLASGVLAGRYRDAAPEPGSRIDRWHRHPDGAAARWADAMTAARHHRTVDTVRRVAQELGATPAAVAVAWTARRPGVRSVVLGPRTLDQLADTLAGVELALDDAQVAALDAASHAAARPVTGIPDEIGA